MTIKPGSMSHSLYDLAWFIRTTAHFNPGDETPLIQEMVLKQNNDGSWGNNHHAHHQFVSTLSAISVLSEYGKNSYKNELSAAIYRANVLWKNLKKDDIPTISFDFVFSALYEKLTKNGIKLDIKAEEISFYSTKKQLKQNKIPTKAIIQQQTTAVHLLETYGKSLKKENLQSLIQNNEKTIGLSPSATLWCATMLNNERLFINQKKLISHNNNSIATLYPIDIYEIGWSLYNKALADPESITNPDNTVKQLLNHLLSNWQKNGISISQDFPLIDLDDTVIVYKLLTMAGHKLDTKWLDYYEEDNYYRCYPMERLASVSVNIHLLDSLHLFPKGKRKQRAIKKVLSFVNSQKIENSYWEDKWHISPLYTTSHAIISLLETPYDLKPTIQWLLKHQRKNGSWGWKNSGSCEETAYIIQALCYYHKYHPQKQIHQALSKAKEYMDKESNIYKYPEMWTGKVLYCPQKVVSSAIQSSQKMLVNC